MKTLHTIYTNFAKRLAVVLTFLMTIGIGNMLAEQYTYVFSTTDNWYTTSNKTTKVGTGSSNNYTAIYYSDNTEWTASGTSHYFNSGYYLLGKSGACLNVPTFNNEKITSIQIFNSSGCSKNVNVAIISGNQTVVNAQKWSTQSSNYIYSISSNYQSSSLAIKVSNGYNAQITKVIINTESVAPACSYTVTFNGNGNTDGSMDNQTFTCDVEQQLTANSFSRTGYTFTEWNTQADGTGTSYTDQQLVNLSSTNNDNITLYAQWQINSYKVTWKPNGGNWSGNASDKVEDYNYGATITTPTNPTRYGYNFTGWNPTPATTMPASDQTYTAQWTEKALTNYRTSCSTETLVTLHPNGGTISEDSWEPTDGEVTYTKTVETTSAVTLPIPTKDGYEFGGWYEHSEFTGSAVTAVPEGTKGEKIYYAKWNCIAPISVTVTPTNENGWRYSIGETISLEATATGGSADAYSYQWQKYIVNTWTDIEGAINRTYTKTDCGTGDGGSYRCKVSTGDGCDTYSEGYFIRVFTLFGGYYGESMTDNKIVWSSANEGVATIHLNASSTYLFKVTDNDGKWFGYGDASNYIVQPWQADCGTETGNGINADIRLFTGPEGDYTFTINIEHSQETSPYVNIAVAYPNVEHPVEGYGYITKWWNECYIHWWDNNNDALTAWGSDARINTYTTICETEYYFFPIIDNYINLIIKDNAGDPSNTTGDQKTKDQETDHSGWYITHDGKSWIWNEFATYTISFDADGGTGSMNPINGICPTTEKTLTINKFKKTGYTFAGWKADKNVTINGNSVAAGTVITDGATIQNITSDITLTAQWQAKIITITWNPNGGTVSPTSSKYTYNGAVVELPTPTRIGYTFNGWFESASGGTPIPDVGNTNKPTEDVTYYAQWTAKPIPTLVWKLNGADVTEHTVTIASESNVFPTLTATPDAIKSGVKFESSEPTVATINANGDIILKSEGRTTIKAYYEEDDTYVAAEATYELIVVESTNCWWEEVTIDDIEYGDEVVVVMVHGETLYALPYDSETASNSNPEATTITTDYFAGTVDETLIWYIMKGDGNTFTLSPKTAINKYLTCNSSNNAVRIDTDSERYFTIENGFLKNTTYSTYLAISTTATPPDWRHFTSTNATIANKYQTLKFYKRVCLPEGQYWVKWMVNGQEYTVGNPTTMVTDGQITAIPDNPANDAIGDCADTFMGWSESNLGSAEGQPAPADLCTAADMKSKHSNVTGNKTFYAVFATSKETTGGTVEASLSFASTAQRDSQTSSKQVWSNEGITFTNNQGSSTSAVADYSDPVRLYKNSEIIVEHTSGEITKIVFDCNSSAYATALKNSIDTPNSNTTVTASSDKVTVTFANAVASFSAKLTSDQVRLDALTVTAGGGTITTYSNYVTNCCELLPVTNLQVSGVTEKSATLTWTAPSPTTGITKLQVRNAETDAIVVDNIAVNTTTATITGLTECTSYQYYVVSVGDCEVVSNIVTATPFSGAKTVNYDYNGGTGSPASFTTNCNNQTITLPVATRTGYTFNGWYTAATGGTRVGDANDTYEPATSPVTLYAQWTINQYTVTWNPNGGNWDGSTSNIVQTYEYGAAINKPADPTRENGIFKGWNPSVPSTMPAGNKTYTAQWEMVYTLTFVDMNAGGTTSTLTQESSGQNIVAPTANSEVCDMWTFIGWAPSNSLNGGTDKPTGFIAAGETISGSQITENKTYYSVYSYNSDNTQEFEVGKSGTYLMYAISGTTKYYATTARTEGFYGNPETAFATYGYPSKFKLTYNKTENKYIIYHENTTSGKESSGYFELNTSNGDVDVKSETPSLFTIQAGSNGAFIICTDYNTSSRSFGYDGNFTDYSGDNPIYFEPASEIQYYNAADCGEVQTYTMSFHNPFGDENALIWYDVEHEDSYYTDKPLNTLIDVFPTMVYNGWAFIGWTANQQYNELIGEDNLDDENSATDNPASSFTIYSNTTGWSYKLNSNVTMYPVFTKYEDNEDIDLGSGGEYYMYFYREDDYYKDDYFGADNHYQRMYALAGGGDNGEFGYTTNCNNAQIFEFIKEGDGWNIRVKNADGTYPTKSYLVNTSGNDYDLVATKPSSTWSITKEAEGDFTMWYRGNTANSESDVYYQAKAREYSGGTSWDFKCYNQDNDASQYYYKVYLGTCENRVFSSNPTNKPAITLSGEPIVTSTQDQSIRAQGELSISATKLAANGTITLTADNADVYFSTVKDANFAQATKPLASLTLNADEKGKLAMTTVYVHYKPTSTSSLGVQTATITATTGTEGEEDYATAETTAHVRNLPAKFVIATKVGATWYALPADLTTASNPLGVVIEVDETNMTATAPNSCTYTLFPVKTTNTEYDRYEEYGDRLRFSAVNNSYKGLWANNSKTDLTINNDMVIDQASDGQTGSDLANNSYYEWKVTTTVVDGHWQYTLQTDQTQNQNYLRYWTSAEGTPIGPKWGTYNAGENKLYFLPVTETQPFEYAVVEWYPTKMLIQTDAAITSPTVKVGGEEVASPVLTSKGGKLYEISNLPLETNPNKLLQVSFTADAVNYVNAKVVPIILSREAKSITGEPFANLTQKVYQYADVVVRDGATLTIDGGTDVANTLLGMTIYPTAKVSVAEGKKLSVHNLTFFGGIDEIYDGSAYTINKYGVPQLSLKGILNKTITNMDYIMRVNLDQMYQVGVPYDVNLSDITYWDGTTMTLGDNLYVSAYDGQKRANREEKSWVWETDFTEKVLKAGIGYTISADKQDADHEYSIIRMPMKNNIMSGNTETAKTVQVYAYDNKNGVEITDNHKGWNYLSNPYMVAISGAEADSKLVVGYLRETGTGPWEWVDDTYRYVTIPSDDGKWYDQQKFEEATLLPFKSFFLQIAESGELSFDLASRQNVPARYLQSSNEQREVEFEVLLANDTRSDNLGFLIGEDYTPAYEINADLEKMIGSMSVYTIYNGYNLAYNALSPTNAAEQIPIGYVVPTVGEYTFALDESSDIEDVEHIYLIDYETSAITDLVTDVYTFTTLEQKSDTRFAINVALKSKDNTATGLDNMNTNGELPTKFIYQEKIYILHHGVIYDATGKRVITINK